MTNEDFNKAYLALMKNPNIDFNELGFSIEKRPAFEKLKTDIKKSLEENRIIEMPSDFEDISDFNASDFYKD